MILIGGHPRSGTTLLRAMLDSHPMVRLLSLLSLLLSLFLFLMVWLWSSCCHCCLWCWGFCKGVERRLELFHGSSSLGQTGDHLFFSPYLLSFLALLPLLVFLLLLLLVLLLLLFLFLNIVLNPVRLSTKNWLSTLLIWWVSSSSLSSSYQPLHFHPHPLYQHLRYCTTWLQLSNSSEVLPISNKRYATDNEIHRLAQGGVTK